MPPIGVTEELSDRGIGNRGVSTHDGPQGSGRNLDDAECRSPIVQGRRADIFKNYSLQPFSFVC